MADFGLSRETVNNEYDVKQVRTYVNNCDYSVDAGALLLLLGERAFASCT